MPAAQPLHSRFVLPSINFQLAFAIQHHAKPTNMALKEVTLPSLAFSRARDHEDIPHVSADCRCQVKSQPSAAAGATPAPPQIFACRTSGPHDYFSLLCADRLARSHRLRSSPFAAASSRLGRLVGATRRNPAACRRSAQFVETPCRRRSRIVRRHSDLGRVGNCGQSGCAHTLARLWRRRTHLASAVLLLALFLAPTTLYALIRVAELHKRLHLPKWLFPEDPQFGPAVAAVRRPARPESVQAAAVLLYACWAIGVAQILHRMHGVSLHFGYSFLILDLVLVAAALWIVIEATRGRNWARLTLLAFFLLGLPSLARTLRFLSAINKLDLVTSLLVVILEAIALVLLFTRSSSAFFAQSAGRIPT